MDDRNSSTSVPGVTQATAPAARAHHAGDGGAVRSAACPAGLTEDPVERFQDVSLGPAGGARSALPTVRRASIGKGLFGDCGQRGRGRSIEHPVQAALRAGTSPVESTQAFIRLKVHLQQS